MRASIKIDSKYPLSFEQLGQVIQKEILFDFKVLLAFISRYADLTHPKGDYSKRLGML
jgi:hypothetical protein